MRSIAWDTLAQLWVWCVLLWTALPLAPPLPSTASAAPNSALFGGFTGTMSGSDFHRPCIIGLGHSALPMRTERADEPERPAGGSPGSRADGFHACRRSLDHAEPRWCSPWRATPCCLPLFSTASALRMETFRGSMLRPRVPLSTLRRRPHGRPRMTRGHRDWLGLRRAELASATTCRSPGARRGFDDSVG
jgi:hypothetical protein